MALKKWGLPVAFFLACALPAGRAAAYPEFQAWVDQQTPRNVNCALCHAHGNGPDGVKPGQIGSLDAEQLAALNEARQAFEPGRTVNSPILNKFGNRIIEKLGRTAFIALRRSPGEFPKAYGFDSDLDGDGIPDAQEYLDGTLAINAHHGAPLALFLHNVKLNWMHIVLITVATLLGLIAINNFMAWFAAVTSVEDEMVAGEADTLAVLSANSEDPAALRQQYPGGKMR